MKTVVGIAIALGVLMLLLSTVWANIFGAASNWTNEKATRSNEANARLHYLNGIIKSGTRNAADKEKAQAEVNTLIPEIQKLNDEFTSVAETPQTVAKVLRWSGISVATLGLIGWYAANQSN